MAEPSWPTRLGPYTIKREIARGGMGVVYEAEDLAGIRVALKVPHAEIAADEGLRAQFVREMRLTAGLRHPNVVQVLHGGDDQGRLFLAMEYVEGVTLQEELQRRGRLAVDATVRIGIQVARALSAAHNHAPPIVHRDLKPGNILLQPDGVVKVVDFGIAKAFERGASATTSPLGTPSYVSPEQLDGVLSSPASDIHALGTILYEMLVGSATFPATLPIAQLIRAICMEVPRPPSVASGLGAAIAPELDVLVAACLAKVPEHRPDAAQIVARLEALARAVEPSAEPTRPVQRTAPPVEQPHAPAIDTMQLVEKLGAAPRPRTPLLMLASAAVLVIAVLAVWRSSDRADAPESTAASIGEHERCVEIVALADVASLRSICVAAGSFEMGSPSTDTKRDADESPVHVALVSALWVGATEVTQAQWSAVMGDVPFDCAVGCGPELPAQNIPWPRAIEFTNRLSQREGLTPCYESHDGEWEWPDPACSGYRLPTETEWEYFARAGSSAVYSFGDDPSGLDAHAWSGPNAHQHVQPVGTKLPNAWGLFDVHGNVWEWCWDWHADAYPAEATAIGYAGPERGEFRVLRGGSFKPMKGTARSAKRAKNKPTGTRDSFGLRIVRTFKTAK